MGVVGRAHGVRGLVRVTSHTDDPAALAGYGPLSGPNGRLFALHWVGDGIAEIFEIVDGKPMKVADRTAAERLTNMTLSVPRNRLPPPEDDEFYLADLQGLAALGAGGERIGVVSAVHDHGAGTILEIARDGDTPLLLPFTQACVPDIRIADGVLTIVPPDEVEVPETRAAVAGFADSRDDATGGRAAQTGKATNEIRGGVAFCAGKAEAAA